MSTLPQLSSNLYHSFIDKFRQVVFWQIRCYLVEQFWQMTSSIYYKNSKIFKNTDLHFVQNLNSNLLCPTYYSAQVISQNNLLLAQVATVHM